MLIRDSTWAKIREHFTEEEKADLRECVTGECICPRGFMLEASDLLPELCAKLKRLVDENR